MALDLTQPVNRAKSDLVRRLGITEEEIQVLKAEAVTWRDGSLGCPQPGMMYTQALVDGYLIQLRAGQRIYNYHGAVHREPFLCEPGQ